MAAEFSVIIVTYNSADVIADSLKSIPFGNEVIVVDNASSDNSAVIASDLDATVIRLEKNIGFGAACNVGAKKARHEHLLFLNPDATLGEGCLEQLSKAFVRYPEVCAFNPKILHADGRQYFRKNNKLGYGELDNRGIPSEDSDITVISGAALAFRKTVFELLNGFDEKIFLYFEDDDLCLRVLASGHKVKYIHHAAVTHLLGKSTAYSARLDFFKEYHFMKSYRYVCRKHGIPFNRLNKAYRLVMRLIGDIANFNKSKAIKHSAHLKAVLETA
jgi:N-acetylglucosaminyl-diphospho-decaprenol L-rhamnosyltransferase